MTRAELVTEILQRLGDSGADIWTEAEIEEYVQEGYDQLTKATGCLLGMALAPDYAASFSYTQEWELDYVPDGEFANGPYQFTSEFERDLLDNARGPANHNYPWEYNDELVTITEVSALVDLPEDLHEIERSTWNTRRVGAMRSQELEWPDSRYELNKGEVQATIQDKDGWDVLRKWRVPSAAYDPYDFDDGDDIRAFTFTQSWEDDLMEGVWEVSGPLQFTGGDDAAFAGATDTGHGTHNHSWEAAMRAADQSNDDGYGILREISDIVDTDVISDGFGDLIQVDGVNVFEDFGILGPIYKERNNLRIEYRRRGATLSEDQDFEIPARSIKYVRHFAQARALEREGDGQELELAAHYQARYEAGIQRMLKRKQAMAFQKTYVLGGMAGRRDTNPRVRLPYQYGKVVR